MRASSCLLSILLLLPSPASGQEAPRVTLRDGGVERGEDAAFRVTFVLEGMSVPWGMAFLPDGRALVTDRGRGTLALLDLEAASYEPLEGLPPIVTERDAGIRDVRLHPDHATNGWIYLSYSAPAGSGSTLAVDRARLAGGRLVDRERLLTAGPPGDSLFHYGGRILVRDGYLWVGVGDRHERWRAQDPGDHAGSILRLRDDGSVPDDNPFVGRAGARPELWSVGHRNPQGMAFHPGTGELWSHEHGPLGGDEINRIVRGGNYGWPEITWGTEYSGEPVGDGETEREGMLQPVIHYSPSLAPSGMAFYTGDAFPEWRHDLFLGSLARRHLRRVELRGGRVVHEEELLADREWRMHLVRQGPDGALYVGVAGLGLVRLEPVDAASLRSGSRARIF